MSPLNPAQAIPTPSLDEFHRGHEERGAKERVVLALEILIDCIN